MSQVEETATKTVAGPASRRSLLSWKVIAVLLVIFAVIAGGAVYWYFLLGERAGTGTTGPPQADAPLPFYLEIKPFVVSTANSVGTPHFVQLGLNLTLPGAEAGNVVSAVLPELQDAMRQTVLGFKVEDIVTPVGIDKMREAMIPNLNRVLLQRLGAERFRRLSGEANKGVVQNIYFSTLIVE